MGVFGIGLFSCGISVILILKCGIAGEIGGYPIPQYRTKKWQIPKYRVENRLNTDTVYFNHLFNRFRILIVAFF